MILLATLVALFLIGLALNDTSSFAANPKSKASYNASMVASSGTNTAWAGPWGISYTANLTPDKETGLGSWTAL